MNEPIYRAELCRLTHLRIKKNDDLTILYFEFYIIGRSNYKYNLKFENPERNLTNQICSICSTIFFDVDLEFNAKSGNCYTFFAVFEYFENEYQDIVAFSPINTNSQKLCWIVINNDDFYSLPIKNIASDLIISYNKLQNLLIYQTLNRINIDIFLEYFSSKILNFSKINKNNEFISFIVEAFFNSILICDSVHSQMLNGTDDYILIRNKKIKKSILKQVFDINEINGKYRLISKYKELYYMNEF